MEKLTFREVREILDLIDGSNATEVKLDLGEISVHVKRHSSAAASTSPTPAPEPAEAPEPSAKAPESAAIASSPAVAAPPVEPASAGEGPEGCIAVKAPLAGVFYVAPSPGAPPFVEVGQKVRANTDICIIEAMKVMNNVKAGVAGEVVFVAAENEAPVEYQAPLVWIRPDV